MAKKPKEYSVRELLWLMKDTVCPECNQQEFAEKMGIKKQNLGAALAGKIWHTGRPCVNGEPGTTAKSMQKYADQLGLDIKVGQVPGTGNINNPIKLTISEK